MLATRTVLHLAESMTGEVYDGRDKSVSAGIMLSTVSPPVGSYTRTSGSNEV